jgi:hypothetical protein
MPEKLIVAPCAVATGCSAASTACSAAMPHAPRMCCSGTGVYWRVAHSCAGFFAARAAFSVCETGRRPHPYFRGLLKLRPAQLLTKSGLYQEASLLDRPHHRNQDSTGSISVGQFPPASWRDGCRGDGSHPTPAAGGIATPRLRCGHLRQGIDPDAFNRWCDALNSGSWPQAPFVNESKPAPLLFFARGVAEPLQHRTATGVAATPQASLLADRSRPFRPRPSFLDTADPLLRQRRLNLAA